MIGSGLKKLAQEQGMTVAKGVAYGNLGGFAATMSEGSGFKQIVFTTKFADAEKLNALQQTINSRNITRELRVRSLTFSPDGINVVFNDTIGTMGKIKEFLDWFLPLLQEAGASGVDVCVECGMPITAGCWKLIDGVAFHMHETCAQRSLAYIEQEEQARRDADEGNYLTGAVGAFLGAILGAIVWALVLMSGYVMSVIGLLIGFLAEKGYTLLKGKQGMGKIAILILAVIFGVVVGTFGADIITIVGMINNGELMIGYTDIPMFLVLLLTQSPEYLEATLINLGQGMLFAGLGVVVLIMQQAKSVSGTKVQDLQ